MRLGVCLSGGGFRAALFALGVLRYLAESRQLSKVVSVSAVSGGSVAAAVLADRWPDLEAEGFTGEAFDRHVAAPFLAVVTERNLRNRGLTRWALTRIAPRRRRLGAAVGVTMARHLLRTKNVAELPPGLQVVLTSTDLVSGRAFRVSRDFVGGWEFGYASTPERLTLATALAASTAVPFLFPPVALRTEGLGLKATAPRELALVDGGVYDNLGLEWFQGWDRGRPDTARAAEFILVVDASGPLQIQPKHFGWISSLRRGQAVQYAQTRASRVRWFVDHLIDGKVRGLYIPIDRDPRAYQPPAGLAVIADAGDGSLPAGFADALSRLRTDLDRFLPDEATLLMYHGYWATHVRLRHLHGELGISHPQWRDFDHLFPQERERLERLLAQGAARSLRRR